MSEPTFYRQQRFLFMTLDPVHVGTGGYRLGRVDLSIVREAGHAAAQDPRHFAQRRHPPVRSHALREPPLRGRGHG